MRRASSSTMVSIIAPDFYYLAKMKILVTGCAGFIGFHLTRRLLNEGHTVVGIDNLNDYYSPALKAARMLMLGIDVAATDHGTDIGCGAFTFIKADIADDSLYADRLNGRTFDAVCHLAAQAGVRYSIDNPRAYISSNITGFFNMLEYCRRNPSGRFVFASSSSVYGNSAAIPYREEGCTDRPVSLYGATKKADEVMAYSYSSLYGIETVGLRFFTVYGPWGRPDMAPFIFTRAILEGTPIDVFNNGEMTRDFTYIDDIMEGICAVLLREPAVDKNDYHIYNIGNSNPVNLNDFIALIERLSGRAAVVRRLPMQPGDVRATWADTSRLRADYGYAPSTPLETGLRAFVEWFREYYGIQ